MEPKSILIADDERHILNVLSIKLRNAGFSVIAAEDGAEAYSLAQSARPEVIIADYQMPLLSGVEVCSKLWADPQTRHIPVVLLTARGFSLSEGDRALGNIKRVIDKPFSPREVLACIHGLLAEVAVRGH